MKRFQYILILFFLTSINCYSKVIESEPKYLDYGSEFKHPLYQVRYKVFKSQEQKDPEIFLFMCGRGMSIEMYEDWLKSFVEVAKPNGVIIYMMNFPGQIVLRKKEVQEANDSGWSGVIKKVKNKFVRDYRGIINNYDEYIKASNSMVSMIYEKHKTPITIASHSMGGHIALRYALHLQQSFKLDEISKTKDYIKYANQHPMSLEISRDPISFYSKIQKPTDLIKSVVMISPMLEVNTGKFGKTFSRILANTATFIGFGGGYVPGNSDYNHKRDSFRGDKQTSFEKGYKKLKKLRKKYGLPMVTYSWLKATFDSIEYLKNADFSDFSIPVLVTLAKDEHIVLNNEAEQILKRVKTAKIEKLDGMHTPFIEKPEIRMKLIYLVDKFLEKLD